MVKDIKKIFLLMMFSAMGIALSFAQTDDQNKIDRRIKEVQEYKMKYIAQEMELSEAQKKKFFEVYQEMNTAKFNCYKDAVNMDRNLRQDKNATEQDYQQVTEAFNKANDEWAQYEKTYNEKFSEFLTQKQIYKMREAENSFRAKFEEMKHNRKRDHHKKPDDKK